MVDTALLETLEELSPVEQRALLAVAEYLKNRRADGVDAPRFDVPDEGLSPGRIAARRFMRENPALMRLLAQ